MSDTQQQSGPLVASDIYVLKEILITIAVAFMVHGLYSTLVVMALYTLWTRSTHLASRGILITVSILMFLCSTTIVALNLANYLVQLPLFGYAPPDIGALLTSIAISDNAIVRLNYLLSDSIVVWRAWVVWPNNPLIRTVVVLCLFGSFAGASIDFTFDTLYNLGNVNFAPLGPRTLTMMLPLFFTNFVTTSLIAYKVWVYQTEIKTKLGREKNKRTKVEKILILLAESGTIYCLLWLLNMLGAALIHQPNALWYQLVANLISQATAIYPIIIILLVALNKTNLEETVTAATFSQPIQFASRPHVVSGIQSEVEAGDTDTSQTTSIRLNPAVDEDDKPTERTPTEKHSSIHFV